MEEVPALLQSYSPHLILVPLNMRVLNALPLLAGPNGPRFVFIAHSDNEQARRKARTAGAAALFSIERLSELRAYLEAVMTNHVLQLSALLPLPVCPSPLNLGGGARAAGPQLIAAP
jgi:hypothetical protein